MQLSIAHSTTVTGSNNGSYQVSLTAWNAGHSLQADALGIVVATGTGANTTFEGRSIAVGSGKLSIANANGTAGNPTLDVVEANLTLSNMGGVLPVAKGGHNGTTAGEARTNLGAQAQDATLDALAAHNTNGLLTQTAADTFTGRSIAGTANQIDVANGTGVDGNPTLSLPATPVVTGLRATALANASLLGGSANGTLQEITLGANVSLDGTTLVVNAPEGGQFNFVTPASPASPTNPGEFLRNGNTEFDLNYTDADGADISDFLLAVTVGTILTVRESPTVFAVVQVTSVADLGTYVVFSTEVLSEAGSFGDSAAVKVSFSLAGADGANGTNGSNGTNGTFPGIGDPITGAAASKPLVTDGSSNLAQVTPIADGTVTVGNGATQDGTITTEKGIVTAIQAADAGYSGTFDPTAVTSITVVKGLITAVS